MPTSVTIFGRTIPIKYLSRQKLLKIYPQGPTVGLWVSEHRTIYINNEVPKREQLYTLYHEMGHAAKTFTGLELILPAELQEVIVQTFATLIEDVLKQSAKLK